MSEIPDEYPADEIPDGIDIQIEKSYNQLLNSVKNLTTEFGELTINEFFETIKNSPKMVKIKIRKELEQNV